MKWLDKLPEWLADYVQEWFVPRADYDEAQERKARATNRAIEAEEEARSIRREYPQLLERAYGGTYRPFEQLVDRVDVRGFRHKDVSIPGETWGWQIRLDNTRFYASFDPKRELQAVKEHAAEELTRKFRQHIREKLFALN